MTTRQPKADQRSGFTTLVTHISHGSNQIRKTRQGKSIFEDEQMRMCTKERTAVPMLHDDKLKLQLKRVIRNTQLTGTYESIAVNKKTAVASS